MNVGWLAERLPVRGYRVEVLTTCARDHFSWQNDFPEGSEEIRGVTVRRFEVNRNRDHHLFGDIQNRISAGLPVSREDQLAWIRESVSSHNLYRFIEKHKRDYDFFIFTPYLFGTTYWGSQVVPEKSLLIPTLHDESYSHLSIFKDMFLGVRGAIFNTPPERDLAMRLYGLPPSRAALAGLGINLDPGADRERFRSRYGMEGDFILYVGRREEGKNTHILTRYFSLYKRRKQSDLKLLFLGTGPLEIPPEAEEDILDMGFLPVEDKYDAHAAATFLCQPSVNESFSIVVMESWVTSVPVLVHASCAVTNYHCRRSNGGLYFRDYLEFEECVDYFRENPEVRKRMGGNGRRYVERNYRWDDVMDRFEKALEKLSS